jgi:hypothetical protein
MQLQITRLPSELSEEFTYSVVTGSGDRYDVRGSELERWLVNLGVDESTIGAVLHKEPNETTTILAGKAA